MKQHFTRCALLAAMFLSVSGFGAKKIPLSLSEVTQRVSKTNFSVQANAQRVYQAKKSIDVARANLLPRLNLWRLASVGVEAAMGNYAASLGIISEIAPFLVPANWFKVHEQKLLYAAEAEGYKALWANEVMTAKSLYYHLLLDRELLRHLEESKAEVQALYLIVQTREILGAVPQGSSRDIEIQVLGLDEDMRRIRSLLDEEEATLAVALGYSATSHFELAPVSLPVIESLKPVVYMDYEKSALRNAPELRQFDQLIAVADYIKKEVSYSFLGVSATTQAFSGGVFDNMAMQDGLGFGLGSSFSVVKSKKAQLALERANVEQTISRHLRALTTNFNLDLETYRSTQRRLQLVEESRKQLFDRVALGDNIPVADLALASKNILEARTTAFSGKFRIVSNQDRLRRLTFSGDYAKAPAMVREPAPAPKKGFKWPWQK